MQPESRRDSLPNVQPVCRVVWVLDTFTIRVSKCVFIYLRLPRVKRASFLCGDVQQFSSVFPP